MAKNITNSKPNKVLNGSSGNDTIQNGYYYNGSWRNGGSKVTITSGAGNDEIWNYGTKAKITSGDGNDYIYNDYEASLTSFIDFNQRRLRQ